MVYLSTTWRNRVVALKQNGFSYSQIRNTFAEEGVPITRASLVRLMRKFHNTGSVEDRVRGRSERKMTALHLVALNELVREDAHRSNRELHYHLALRYPDLQVSISTIARMKNRVLEWDSKLSSYCQFIRQANKVKRLRWAVYQALNPDDYENVTFVDESRVEAWQCCRRINQKRGEPKVRSKKPKKPQSVLVWGGISRRGATPIVIFKNTMDSTFYQEKILTPALIPFLQIRYPEGHRLFCDNDPKHTSKSTVKFMEEKQINWWRSPAESPDANPIERVWREMKNYVNRYVKPRTEGELVQGIKDFWATMTPAKCNRYINKIYTVIPEMIRQQGDVTRY